MVIMRKTIVLRRFGRGVYGNEYKASFFLGKKKIHDEVMLGSDVRSGCHKFVFPKGHDFRKARIRRTYGKRRKLPKGISLKHLNMPRIRL